MMETNVYCTLKRNSEHLTCLAFSFFRSSDTFKLDDLNARGILEARDNNTNA